MMSRVLLIDDNPDTREAVAQYLRINGHNVRTAPNGKDAMEALTSDTPDVVVLDYKMPEMDGISFLEVIRCYLRWQSLPVILVTAYPEGAHIRRASELGVRKTFLKSEYELSDLLGHIEACG
jgi:CheY-like chemotaxis protein